MRVIKRHTKGELNPIFERHQKSRLYELNDCYKNASQNKYDVYKEIQQIMREYDGFDLRIICYNTFVFTTGFFGYINNRLHFFYITPETIRYTEIE